MKFALWACLEPSPPLLPLMVSKSFVFYAKYSAYFLIGIACLWAVLLLVGYLILKNPPSATAQKNRRSPGSPSVPPAVKSVFPKTHRGTGTFFWPQSDVLAFLRIFALWLLVQPRRKHDVYIASRLRHGLRLIIFRSTWEPS